MTHPSPALPPDRMPPLPMESLNDEQRAAAEALIAGPRKAVIGPFIPLLRSPVLLDRVQRVGEFLRFHSTLGPRISEFATLVVSRRWTQQFEWFMHAPLALKAGTAPETVEMLRAGQRPTTLNDDEALVYDFLTELETTRGVSDGTYQRALARLGETGIVELTSLAGYFTMISMVLNVARTPPLDTGGGHPLEAFPR